MNKNVFELEMKPKFEEVVVLLYNIGLYSNDGNLDIFLTNNFPFTFSFVNIFFISLIEHIFQEKCKCRECDKSKYLKLLGLITVS